MVDIKSETVFPGNCFAVNVTGSSAEKPWRYIKQNQLKSLIVGVVQARDAAALSNVYPRRNCGGRQRLFSAQLNMSLLS